MILASVSITVVFGDNGILQLAKEAGEKTNEAVKNDKENIGNVTNYIKSLNWDTSKVTAVTTKDGGIVPVPKGFVGSEVDGENTIKDGFVIYEIPEGENLDWKKDKGENGEENGILDVQENYNQFVWVPADGISLEYKQYNEIIKEKYDDGYIHKLDDEKIDFREQSVEKYGGFYVARYEAGVPESVKYNDGEEYKASVESRNKSASEVSEEDLPATKKGLQAWNFISQSNAKNLSETLYSSNESVESRLIDSYAWDTICVWLKNSGFNLFDSTSWGNYMDADEYSIKGLYAVHIISDGKTKIAEKYYKSDNFLIPKGETEWVEGCEFYELATGISERNKANNIYDFAGNMYEWTTEIDGNGAIQRGGSINDNGSWAPACWYHNGLSRLTRYEVNYGFRTVLYIK